MLVLQMFPRTGRRFPRQPFRNAQGVAIDRFQLGFAAHHPELLAMGVVGECFHHVGAGVDEVAMQLG